MEFYHQPPTGEDLITFLRCRVLDDKWSDLPPDTENVRCYFSRISNIPKSTMTTRETPVYRMEGGKRVVIGKRRLLQTPPHLAGLRFHVYSLIPTGQPEVDSLVLMVSVGDHGDVRGRVGERYRMYMRGRDGILED